MKRTPQTLLIITPFLPVIFKKSTLFDIRKIRDMKKLILYPYHVRSLLKNI